MPDAAQSPVLRRAAEFRRQLARQDGAHVREMVDQYGRAYKTLLLKIERVADRLRDLDEVTPLQAAALQEYKDLANDIQRQLDKFVLGEKERLLRDAKKASDLAQRGADHNRGGAPQTGAGGVYSTVESAVTGGCGADTGASMGRAGSKGVGHAACCSNP